MGKARNIADSNLTTLSASGSFSANGGATLGDASGDALTINSSAVSIPNGLNFDSNTFVIDAANNRIAVNGSDSSVGGGQMVVNQANNNGLVINQTGSGNGASIYLRNNTDTTINNFNFTNSGVRFFDVGTATERMRIDSSGNVGIGTSSPGYRLDVAGGLLRSINSYSAAYNSLIIQNTASNGYAQTLYFVGSDGANGAASVSYAPGIFFAIGPTANDTTTPIVFRNNNATERMRIDSSGSVFINTTSGISGTTSQLTIVSPNLFNTAAGVGIKNNTNNTGGQFAFFVNSSNSTIGSISQATASSVAYNTTSDYRLKENIAPMTGALARVSALKPVTYTWKADGVNGEGFIAHELAEVCPSAVTGEKDAVDANGNPKYQGIDTSYLVATLAAAIQEQQAIITDLKERIAVLESK